MMSCGLRDKICSCKWGRTSFDVNRENITKDGPLLSSAGGHGIGCNIGSISAPCPLMHALESKETPDGKYGPFHVSTSFQYNFFFFSFLILSKGVYTLQHISLNNITVGDLTMTDERKKWEKKMLKTCLWIRQERLTSGKSKADTRKKG